MQIKGIESGDLNINIFLFVIWKQYLSSQSPVSCFQSISFLLVAGPSVERKENGLKILKQSILVSNDIAEVIWCLQFRNF